jgi:glycosyltransferase involved in cell wall biosynthesis
LAVFADVLQGLCPAARIDFLTREENQVPVAVLADRFGVALERARVRPLPPERHRHLAPLRTLRRLMQERNIAEVSAEYDLFVNMTIFSVVRPLAKRSVYICMFPLDPRPAGASRSGLQRLLLAPYGALRRRLYRRWIGSYGLLLAISEFTGDWVRRLWGLEAVVLYPPVETGARIHLDRKTRTILAVGRFFPADHNKKHDVLIEMFARLVREGLSGWELHLVGGRTRVPGTDAYIRRLEELAAGLPVVFHVDASRERLRGLLETAAIFWHATGYGEDIAAYPYKLEHFGMSTVEAMGNGCVPVVHACGGQPEIIEQGRSGFLWSSLEEFHDLTLRLVEDRELREELARRAFERSRAFGRERFRSSAADLLTTHLR